MYPDAPAVALPREVAPPVRPVLEAVAQGTVAAGPGPVDLAVLAQLLFFSAGLTKRKVHPGGETIHFRAAASTGALYQTEVYVLAGAVAGLEPGVYHFCAGDFTLRQLRAGDHRASAGGERGSGRSRRGRASDPSSDGHPLAEHLEVPGARVPALLSGMRERSWRISSRPRSRATSPPGCFSRSPIRR